jgi:hypothetical protein
MRVAMLKEAANGAEPEVRRRARQVIERLEAPPFGSFCAGAEQSLPGARYL